MAQTRRQASRVEGNNGRAAIEAYLGSPELGRRGCGGPPPPAEDHHPKQRMSLKGTLREALRAALDLLTFCEECEQADSRDLPGALIPRLTSHPMVACAWVSARYWG
jgi:hypothetical protein